MVRFARKTPNQGKSPGNATPWEEMLGNADVKTPKDGALKRPIEESDGVPRTPAKKLAKGTPGSAKSLKSAAGTPATLTPKIKNSPGSLVSGKMQTPAGKMANKTPGSMKALKDVKGTPKPGQSPGGLAYKKTPGTPKSKATVATPLEGDDDSGDDTDEEQAENDDEDDEDASDDDDEDQMDDDEDDEDESDDDDEDESDDDNEAENEEVDSNKINSSNLVQRIPKKSPKPTKLAQKAAAVTPKQGKTDVGNNGKQIKKASKHPQVPQKEAPKKIIRDLCYGCRQPGHNLRNCPNIAQEEKTELCYKCGSCDHVARECRKKSDGSYPFAKCFVCSKTGHISRDCPQNEHGVYPGGGHCSVCGSKRHKRYECPDLRKSKVVAGSVVARVQPVQSVDGNEDDDVKVKLPKNVAKKVVTF